MIVALFASVALVSVALGETTAQALMRMSHTFTFSADPSGTAKITGTGTYRGKADQKRHSHYIADYTNGYTNPRYDHCVLIDCVTEVRCTDFARYAQDKNGEDTECTMEHTRVTDFDACHVHSRLNTYDYYQQWWITYYPEHVDYAVIQCYQKSKAN